MKLHQTSIRFSSSLLTRSTLKTIDHIWWLKNMFSLGMPTFKKDQKNLVVGLGVKKFWSHWIRRSKFNKCLRNLTHIEINQRKFSKTIFPRMLSHSFLLFSFLSFLLTFIFPLFLIFNLCFIYVVLSVGLFSNQLLWTIFYTNHMYYTIEHSYLS